jgi:hypothetical protein
LAARTYNHKKVLILNAYPFLFLCQVNLNCSTALHGLHYPIEMESCLVDESFFLKREEKRVEKVGRKKA